MIRLAAYGRGERAAAAPAQRLSVQGPRRDRRRGGARGRRSLGPPLPGGQSPPEPRRTGGVSVGQSGRRPGAAVPGEGRMLRWRWQPRVPLVGSPVPCLHGSKSRSLFDT